MPPLALVRPAQTDYSDTTRSLGERERVELVTEHAKRPIAPLAVVSSVVYYDERMLKVEVSRLLEGEPATFLVSLTLLRVEADTYLANCTHNKPHSPADF